MKKVTNQQVGKAFAYHSEACNHRGSFHTDCGRLFSYATLIGFQLNGFTILSDDSMSRTTSKHLAYAARACSNVVYLDLFSWDSASVPTETEVLGATIAKIKTLKGKADRARTKRDYYLHQLDFYRSFGRALIKSVGSSDLRDHAAILAA